MAKPRRRSPRKDIRTIRRSLLTIAKALGRLAPLLAAMHRAGSGERPPRLRKLKLSAKRRAALKLQGQYIGHMRKLKPRQKARVKALRAAKGVRAAIRFARRLGRG